MLQTTKALALFALSAFAFAALAVVPADHMTCEQAVRHYEKHGRIYVIGNAPDDIVPIYGMKPKSKWREVRCSGRGKTRRNYWVETRDNDTCVIAVYCG